MPRLRSCARLAGPGRRVPSAVRGSLLPAASPGSRLRELRAHLGVPSGTAAAQLGAAGAARALPRSHESRAPPAAASGRAEPARRPSSGLQVAKLGSGFGGTRGHTQLRRPARRPLDLCPRLQTPSGCCHRMARALSRLSLACPDFVPLCSVQEKLRLYTRIEAPLARVTLPQEKWLSYPTWWSAEAGSLARCCGCKRLGAQEAPVQRRETERQQF